MIKSNPNCPNKHCNHGVITYDGQTGKICKKCNPDTKSESIDEPVSKIHPFIKEKIYSKYWGLKICKYAHSNILVGVGTERSLSTMASGEFGVNVISIEDITIEDLIHVVKLSTNKLDRMYPDGFEIEKEIGEKIVWSLVYKPMRNGLINGLIRNLVRFYSYNGYPTIYIDGFTNHLNIATIDYLRSKGYALPAEGYSVAELVEEGVFILVKP